MNSTGHSTGVLRFPPASPCSRCEPRSARDVSTGAREPCVRSASTGACSWSNRVSTASGVGPLCARPWTGHVIEETDGAVSACVPDSRPLPPGGAWCAHHGRQGVLTEALGESKRLSHAQGLGRVPLVHACYRERSSSETAYKEPWLQTISIATAVERKPILCAAPHVRPIIRRVFYAGAAQRILMSHARARHEGGAAKNPYQRALSR